MNPRNLTGYLCVAAGFALIVALGSGAMEPLGMTTIPRSGRAMLTALAPSVLLATGLFVLGLWLLKGKRRP